MLEAIRKRSSSLVVKILLGLLILSFAAWGIGDMIRAGTGMDTVAEVGSADIGPNALSAEVQRELSNLRQALGPNFNQDAIRMEGLAGVVVRRMVDRTLIGLGAHDLGVAVGDDQVSEEIRKSKAFFNELGHFDRQVFEQAIRSRGWSEGQFVDLMRGDLIRSQYINATITGGPAPETMVNTLYQYRRERRLAQFVEIPDASMPDAAEPAETVLAEYHETNAARYTAPEYRGVTAVLLKADDLAAEMAVSEDDLRQAFDVRAGEFQAPERRRVQQMLLSTEDKAIEAHQRLTAGDSFVDVAKNVAGMDEALLDLGTVTRDELLPEMADAAFALDQGAFSAPVQSPLGWHILRVETVEPGHQQTFEDVRETLAKDLRREKAVDALYEMANKLEDALGGGATLEEAARQLNLKLFKTAAVDAEGKGPNGEAVADLPPAPFLPTAFSTDMGETSMLTETGRDGYFILRVDEIRAPELRPLDTVRADVLADWRADRRAEAAGKAVDALAEAVRGGHALTDAATQQGLTVRDAGPMTRDGDGAPEGIAPKLVTELFAVKVGGVVTARGTNGHQLAVLAEVKPADPASEKPMVDEIERNVSSAMRSDLMAELAAGLRVRHPVSINGRAIQQMYAQDQ